MSFDAIKDALQVAIDQDVDALWEDFRVESGSTDLSDFLERLCTQGLLTEEASAKLTEQEPAPEELEDADTVPRKRRAAITMMFGGGGDEDDEDDVEPAGGGDTRKSKYRRTTGGGLEALESSQPTPAPSLDPGPANPLESDRYEFLGSVGSGAMGDVHLAKDNTLHRNVAYKVMSPDLSANPIQATKFANEAEITAQLEHPNIVPVYAQESSTSYTMKLVEGRTLEQILEETRKQELAQNLDEEHSLEARLNLFVKLCDALEYAHSRGVIHRDLKPENIMVGAFGEVYVMDWGIAKVFDPGGPKSVTLSRKPLDEGELIIGTAGYMSPEQAEGHNHELNGASDQYALGLILFEMVSLNYAVTGKVPLKIVMRHQDGEKDPLKHITGKAIPREIVSIIHKATAKGIEHRYASVGDLADDLRRYLRGDAVLARPDTPFQMLIRWMGKHREATLMAFLLLFTSSFVMVMGIFQWNQIMKARAQVAAQQESNLRTLVAKQASLIDGSFLKYEGLLSVIATATQDRVERGEQAKVEDLYFASSFEEEGAPREHLVTSEHYGQDVDLLHGSIVMLDEAGRMGSEDARQMALLAPLLKKTLLRSYSEEATRFTNNRAQDLMTKKGVPVSWSFMGLESGAYMAYPGHGGFEDDYDYRDTEWYQRGSASKGGPTWGSPKVDPFGLNRILTCVQKLEDETGNLVGVVGIDVTFNYLIDKLMVPDEWTDLGEVETYLIDEEGYIVVRSAWRGQETRASLRSSALRMSTFPHPEVVADIKAKRSGAKSSLGQLVMYHRLNSTGWYFAVAGDEDAVRSLDASSSSP